MGEGANGLDRVRPGDPAEPRVLEREVDRLRGELDCLMDELARRRREAFDLRLQLERHATAVAVSVLALAVVVSWRTWRRHG